jgi:hypothetical protein
MSKVQTDIRTTSYDAATANAHGYQGTIEDALAQVRSEVAVAPRRNGRQELLGFLRVDRSVTELSGLQSHLQVGAYRLPPSTEDDSVVYGPAYEDRNYIVPREDGPVISKYSLEYAIQRGWVVVQKPADYEFPMNWGLPS